MRTYSISVKGPNKDFSVMLSEVEGWRAFVTWLIDSIPSRLCCGRFTNRIFYKPVHALLEMTYPWWKEIKIPVTKEQAQQIDPEFVGYFNTEE